MATSSQKWPALDILRAILGPLYVALGVGAAIGAARGWPGPDAKLAMVIVATALLSVGTMRIVTVVRNRRAARR
jgi:hypothetical protein